jgi:sortase A
MQALNWLQRLLIAIGCGCLTASGIRMVEAASFQETATVALERQLHMPAPAEPADDPVQASEDRIAPPAPIGDDSVAAPTDVGLVGLLEIPRLQLSVVVMEGDDDRTLARAVGHLPGTALPWQSGNTVMAGHRDTFFRPLRDLRAGDEIRVTTTRGLFDYHVLSTEIVAPDDVSALAPTPDRSLTLVTCYPFVYVGRAPQRFIVRAR